MESTRREILVDHVWSGPCLAAPEDAWRVMGELPSSGELLNSSPPAVLQRLNEPPQQPSTRLEYLGKHHALLRCEGTEPLRRAVQTFRASPERESYEGFSVYSQVRVLGYYCTTQGVACRVSFGRSLTKIPRDQSRSLKEGALVAVSTASDSFKGQCRVAVVANRALVSGRIELFWAEEESDLILDPAEELIIIEADGGYYESLRYAMLGLQIEAERDSSKFDEYIINGSDAQKPANYTLSSGVKAPCPPRFPQLDATQKEAFYTMISKELAVIQGPPGTGKTFTSTMALESYSRMFAKLPVQPNRDQGPVIPIVVCAQTNHALDQLLGHCHDSNITFARLGGRTQSATVKEHTMHQLRQKSSLRPRIGTLYKIRDALIARMKSLLSVSSPRGLVSATDLANEGIITQEQLTSLLSDDEWETADPYPTTQEGDLSAPSEEEKRLQQWLGLNTEHDISCTYKPPKNQSKPETTAETTAETTTKTTIRAETTPETERRALEADIIEQEEREHRDGVFIPIKMHPTGRIPTNSPFDFSFDASSHQPFDASSHQAIKILQQYTDLWDIPTHQRGLVYQYMRSQLAERSQRAPVSFRQCLIQYRRNCLDIKVCRWETDIEILRSQKVQIIGCTTTGLTKYRGLIAALKPKVLLVEEASQTREANITSGLVPSLDQLVLVGDHQQLTPSVDVAPLAGPPHNFDVSLIQRLIYAGVPYTMLRVQRRMTQGIRGIINAFYPELEDHPSILKPYARLPVPGMGLLDYWWFQHTWEQSVDSTPSYLNEKEAQMVAGLAVYLVQNGMRRSEITILTFYSGQQALLERLLAERTGPEVIGTGEWCVRTVDSFQGEENEVIILSLVRSSSPTQSARAGFVESENRATVALSRAKRGLYVFGNGDHLMNCSSQSRETWSKVIDAFKAPFRRYDMSFPTTCVKHARLTYRINPIDWISYLGGGCEAPCDFVCSKGHKCTLLCHATKHSHIQCRVRCEKLLTCGHPCDKFCGKECQCKHGCEGAKAAPPKALPKAAPKKTLRRLGP